MFDLTPIFIMGAPRSGTTMLANMLASNPDSIALPEMHYIHNLLEKELLYGQLSSDCIVKVLKQNFMFVDLNIISSDDDFDILLGDSIKDVLNKILALYNIKYFKKSYRFWIEHTPHNHKYFNVLSTQYSNAKFIHIVRDGRAVYYSTKETDWGYKDIVLGARRWRENVLDCLILDKIFPNKVITVKYENLVTQTERTLRSICDFVGMKYLDTMIGGKGIILPSFSKYSKDAGSKPNTNSLDKWQRSLKEFEIKHFNAVNQDVLNLLNYDVNSYGRKELIGIKKILIRIIGYLKMKYSTKSAQNRFNSVFNENN